MVRNVRWLYNKLGTVDISGIGNGTVSSGLNTVQSELNGKADEGHTHGVGDLPVSNSQVNSTSYVPSSSVTYSLNTLINELGTEIDEIKDQVASTVIDTLNNTYESKSLGTWSSASDVDTFLSRFNHNSFYSDGDTTLAIGNYVTIYGSEWVIAGFDMEYNRTAADGTVYNNGYGICMIPKTYAQRYGESGDSVGAYIYRQVHTKHIPNIAANLRPVLGSHLITRNVLLSNSTDTFNYPSYSSNGYEWTIADGTLMSGCQITGSVSTYKNQYDDGEANYRLPLFKLNYESVNIGINYWIRGVYGYNKTNGMISYCIDYTGNMWRSVGDSTISIRPMIYIR